MKTLRQKILPGAKGVIGERSNMKNESDELDSRKLDGRTHGPLTRNCK